MSGNAARPHPMLDEAMRVLGLTLDKQLAMELEVHQTVLSLVRHGRRPVRDGLLLAVHEATGIPFRRLRELAGLPSPQLSFS